MNERPPTNALTKSPFLKSLEASKEELLSGDVPVKAAKQRVNSLKQTQELALRELAAPAVAEVLAKALQLALSGNTRMIELILSYHLSKPAAMEEDTGARPTVQILVQNLTTKGGEMTVGKPGSAPAVTIEATVLGIEDVKATAPRHNGNAEGDSQINSVGPQTGTNYGFQQSHGSESSDGQTGQGVIYHGHPARPASA